MCYMGHRRFLPLDYERRLQPELFDGHIEEELRLEQLSGSDILEQVNQFEEYIFGNSVKERKRAKNWLKKSLFFELPYWGTLMLRHNLDVMHIERNICENMIGTLLNIKGRTKDNLKSRLDLQQMGIRTKLHPVQHENKWHLAASCCTLSLDEKNAFCEYFNTLKVPDGFSSTIGGCVNLKGRKIFGLKSHDYHVIMEYLLPYALQGLMKKDVRDVLIDLSNFFKTLCSKVVKVDDIKIIEDEIIRILCRMEMMFPPSFFDVMVHLLVHLPNEVRISGSVQYRWMYPFERYLSKLKAYVRNRAHPEESIAEGYIAPDIFIPLKLSSIK
ncbi:uncharacterized protein LOC111013454 [Momordica charantia]|uniref:Uncharacterized protein LOC111013454 n=1 Tax=Momordica charantia TaxID=3673 RepID=A0A6J1CQR4_MOMCH|nr:uncharacterized protein LOC111013454 [Momordica charantia]XP_022143596.1 uncharacterized protein LOC111013454 [Momordica charantia]XP_022143597.1 uncharacterized protein LOC111013454 [Momordica charantia]